MLVKLEPRLSESSPSKVHLERHVTPPLQLKSVQQTETNIEFKEKIYLNIVLNTHCFVFVNRLI